MKRGKPEPIATSYRQRVLFSYHPPLEGEGRLAACAARRESGWGDAADSAFVASPHPALRATLPLQGRVKVTHVSVRGVATGALVRAS
jgi:hypothetical protein